MADLLSRSDEELFNDTTLHGEALSELIRRHKGAVFALAKRFSSLADYEELLSDGFCALADAVGSFDSSRGSFSSYAYTCILNAMKSTVQKSARRKSMISDAENYEEELERSGIAYPSPEDVFLERLAGEELYKVIAEQLTPLEMKCLDGVVLGLRYDEIARQLGIDRKSADNALARARAKLRRYFNRK